MSPGIPTRLVQLMHPDEGRRAALVYQNQIHLLATYRSIYAFALAALETGWKLRDLLSTDLSGIVLDYGEIHARQTAWTFLPCFDHPDEPGRCVVSSAGPPWHYIGSGASLRGHGEPVTGAEYADISAAYVIAPDGTPRRVGVAQAVGGRVPSVGPELILDAELPAIEGTAHVFRAGRETLTKRFSGGDAPLLLALAAIEPDHFESADYRRPGDAHVHLFGQRLFGEQGRLAAEPGDEVSMELEGLGRPLRNSVRAADQARRRVAATPL